jgi:replicative DNA helicase
MPTRPGRPPRGNPEKTKGAPGCDPKRARKKLSMTNNTTNPNGSKPPDNTPPIYRLADLLDEFAADVDAKYQAQQEGRKLGPSTGHPGLDRILGEYLANGLHLIQGAPGAGKSAFALQMAGHCGFPCLYISTEMPAIELLRRTTARVNQTYIGKLRTGELGVEESLRQARKAAERCPDLAFVDALRAPLTVEHILQLAGALRVSADARNILVVIDSAQAWIRQRVSLNGRDEYQETNTVIGDLFTVADTLKCPVITVSHKNREGNKGNGSQAHSAKGSGLWEYQIESGIDLAREEDTPKDADGEVPVKATVWKNRNGDAHVSQLLKFHGGFQSFREAEAAAAAAGRRRREVA